jgi:hypothetical protein
MTNDEIIVIFEAAGITRKSIDKNFKTVWPAVRLLEKNEIKKVSMEEVERCIVSISGEAARNMARNSAAMLGIEKQASNSFGRYKGKGEGESVDGIRDYEDN